MKPTLFQNQADLIQMLNSMPLPDGETKFGNAAEIKERLILLVPKIFDLREVLVNDHGGVGNYKSLYRYADEASDNVSRETVEALKMQMEAIDDESQKLLDFGADEDMVSANSNARGAVAQFDFMRNTILGFKAKLQKVLARVETKYENLSETLVANRAALKRILGTEASLIENDYAEKVTAMKELSYQLDDYCALNIAYFSMFLK